METPSADGSSPQLTVDYRPGPSMGHLPLALASGPDLATAEDLRVLLRRRLRYLFPLLVVLYGVALVLIHSSSRPLARFQWPYWSVVACLFISALLAGLVWTRRPFSLGQLRAIELVLV